MADQPESKSVIAFGPTTKSAASNDGDQLDAAGQTILELLQRPQVSPKQIADMRWIWRKNCHISFAPPKIGSGS